MYNVSAHTSIHAGNNTDFVQIKPTIIWNLGSVKLKCGVEL